MNYRKKRDWSQYNQKLKNIATIEFHISRDALKSWHYSGFRGRGGKFIYRDSAMELCLMIREFYGLALRQTEGFIGSMMKLMFPDISVKTPEYSTLSRRASSLNPRLKKLLFTSKEPMIVAIDSTGLSIYNHRQWQVKKHGSNMAKWQDKWRKLHLSIDVKTGEVQSAEYTESNVNDCLKMPKLLNEIDGEVEAVAADMAYDTVNCREAIRLKKAKQLIPPNRRATTSKNNRNIRKNKEILKERDEAINYINHNSINNNKSLARASWKQKTGYHARSLVETTMWQIKAHCGDVLSNKTENNRNTQALIRVKLLNKIINT